MAKMWSTDPVIEAARALPGWCAFMRLCGRERVFFLTERHGAGFRSEASTVRPVKNSDCWAHQRLALGDGETPVAAVLDALEKSGVAVDGARDVLLADGAAPASVTVATVDDDFAGLLGGDDVVDEFEGLLG